MELISRIEELLQEMCKISPKYRNKHGYLFFDTNDPDTIKYIVLLTELKFLQGETNERQTKTR
jgi:hypothetical protein